MPRNGGGWTNSLTHSRGSYLSFTNEPMPQTDGNNPVTFRDGCNIFVGRDTSHGLSELR